MSIVFVRYKTGPFSIYPLCFRSSSHFPQIETISYFMCVKHDNNGQRRERYPWTHTTLEIEGEERITTRLWINGFNNEWKALRRALGAYDVFNSNDGHTGCSWKNCACFTATPPSPTLLYETFKALNAMRVYSHSYKLVFFLQPIAAECWRGRGGKLSRIFRIKT